MSRRSLKVLLTVSLVLAFVLIPFFKPQEVSAATVKLETQNVKLIGGDVYQDADSMKAVYWVDVEKTSDSCNITGVEYNGNADKIVKVTVPHSSYIRIEGLKDGKCTVQVLGEQGHVCPVEIEVTKEYMDQKLYIQSKFGHICYGQTKLKVKSWPNTTVTLSVGSTDYSPVKTDEKGLVTIPLKKVYKMDTKFLVKLKNGKYAADLRGGFGNHTYLKKAAAKKYTIKVKCYNLHKGDIVKVKYKKKVYAKKITKNYHHKNKTVAFKVKKKVKAKNKFVVAIYDKYKKPHSKIKFQVKKGTSACKILKEVFYGEYE